MDADPADDRLVRFARIVAHGMRNPLAIATGMLDLLDRQVGDELDDELRELLRRSSDAIRRAADQLLELQRYTSAHRSPLHLDDVDVEEALAEALESLGAGAPAVQVVGPLPVLRADPAAVARALEELLDNAQRHAVAQGATVVRVSATDAGAAWEVAVSDDGPGIAADQRPVAMEEGERLGRTGDGFGLGLPTARTLVRRHGGELLLDESPGGGLRAVLRWAKEPPSDEDPAGR